jgi:hypothetical protein
MSWDRTAGDFLGIQPERTSMHIVKALSIIACVSLLAIPANSAPRAKGQNGDGKSQEQACRDQIGKEAPEGEGRSGPKLQAQRLGECMPKAR